MCTPINLVDGFFWKLLILRILLQRIDCIAPPSVSLLMGEESVNWLSISVRYDPALTRIASLPLGGQEKQNTVDDSTRADHGQTLFSFCHLVS